jgi:hypothetical protein
MSSANLPSAASMEEAANRPLEYDPTTRAQYIRTMLHDITKMIASGESEESIRSKVAPFIEQYPELFKKLIKKEDLTPIHDMLRLLDDMGKGKLSQHQASVVVGKSLVDRYVTPQLKGANK